MHSMRKLLVVITSIFLCGSIYADGVRTVATRGMAQSFLANSQLVSSEYTALYELYNATDGVNWKWNTSSSSIAWDFSGTSDPCDDSWQGVTCTPTYQVFSLDLESLNLNGTLPDSINTFQALTGLVLNENLLKSSIPSTLGELPNLEHLDLSNNKLQGSIPSSLGQCTSLLYINLVGNDLTGSIPPSFANLCSLQYWFMENNRINGTLPNVFQCMTGLKVIDMDNNQITGHIPSSISLLHNLVILSVNLNQLSGVIPSDISNLGKLEHFNLCSNKLSGTIPTTLGSLVSLQSLYICSNRFTGNLPAELGSLPKLFYIDMLYNKLTGTLPASWGNLAHMQQILLYNNLLTGTIPESYGNFTKILLLMLSSNHLTGSLPSSIGQLAKIEYFDCGFNHLTGSIPDTIDGLQQMKFLYLYENDLSGSIPSTIGALWRLQEMKLLTNHLDGSVPTTLQRMGNLTVLLLYNNLLTGTLDGVFNASTQLVLSTVQISTNRLTGTLPEELFRLPALLTVVAVSNCFSGSLPENTCDSQTVRTIALDGLRSAPNCQQKLLPGISSAYNVIDPWRGPVPMCLFNMLHLTKLHLSGNGYTGSLPAELNISTSLVGLSLSHNALTGTIPLSMQQRVWSNLDLSYNRLSGTLTSSFAAALVNDSSLQGSVALFLDNNRFSGRIPAAVATIQNISILASNVFTCKLDRSDLPKEDSDVGNYQCGSSSFNAPFFIWFGCATCAGVALVCYSTGIFSESRFPRAVTALRRVQKWLGAEDSSMILYAQFGGNLRSLVRVSLRCFLYVLLVLAPLYIGLSTAYGTVVYQSAYVVSAGFLSGVTPLVLLMIALLGLVLLFAASFVVELKVLGYQRAARGFSVFHNTRSTAERFTVYAAFIVINFTFVIGVNAAYVYVALYESGSLLLAVQILLSFFKLFWNKVCASYLVRAISSYISGFELQAVEEYSREFMSIQLVIALFNNIAIPCLVVAVVSPSCFNNAFIAAPAVGAVYEYADCTSGFVTSTDSCSYSVTSGTTTYDAPFAYSYQCSATFVTYYAPAFMYLCVTASFLHPAANVLLCALYRRASAGSVWQRTLSYQLSRMLKLPTYSSPPPAEHNVFKPLFEASGVMTSVLTYIGLLLTFGAVFPPLAAALTVTIVSTVLISRATVGRVVSWACEGGHLSYLRVIEVECRDMTNPLLLRNALRILVIFACWFYTLFLFDTLGDAVGFDGAYWVLIVMPLVPMCFYAAFVLLGRSSYAEQLQRQQRTTSRALEGVELAGVSGALAEDKRSTGPDICNDSEEATVNILLQTQPTEA